MQKIEEIEKHYLTPDPWGYKTNPEDQKRKERILNALEKVRPGIFHRVLDIGCGEAWLTQFLPAVHKHGYELSDNAAKRFPSQVLRTIEPTGLYDLVVTTGTLYSHYDYKKFYRIISEHSSETILTCAIRDWERGEMSDPEFHERELGAIQIYEEEFPYMIEGREHTQKLRIFRKKAAQ